MDFDRQGKSSVVFGPMQKWLFGVTRLETNVATNG